MSHTHIPLVAMVKFTAETTALLERLVREKKIEGMLPRNVRTHPNYAEAFKGIKSAMFSARLRRFREKYAQETSKNGTLFSLFLTATHSY